MRVDKVSHRYEGASAIGHWLSSLYGIPAEVASLGGKPYRDSDEYVIRPDPFSGPIIIAHARMSSSVVAFSEPTNLVTVVVSEKPTRPVSTKTATGIAEIINFRFGPQIVGVPEHADYLSLTFPYKLVEDAFSALGISLDLADADGLIRSIFAAQTAAAVRKIWAKASTESASAEEMQDISFAYARDLIVESLAADLGAHLIQGRPLFQNPDRKIIIACQEVLEAIRFRRVSVRELSKTVGVGTPYINKAFGAELGCTAKEWAQTFRLILLRSAIKKCAMAQEPFKISEIAKSFGFNHSGRFSRSYQLAFDEYPSSTVKRISGLEMRDA